MLTADCHKQMIVAEQQMGVWADWPSMIARAFAGLHFEMHWLEWQVNFFEGQVSGHYEKTSRKRKLTQHSRDFNVCNFRLAK